MDDLGVLDICGMYTDYVLNSEIHMMYKLDNSGSVCLCNLFHLV